LDSVLPFSSYFDRQQNISHIQEVFALIFVTYLPESQIKKNFLFIQRNSFIIFTFPNPFCLFMALASGLARRLSPGNYKTKTKTKKETTK